MSIQIQEDKENISSTLDAQDNKISSFTTSYNEHLDKICTRNKVSTKIETEKTELEATTNTKIDEFKTESKPDKTTTLKSLDMKPSDLTSGISALTSDKNASSYEQPSDYLIIWPPIKPPEKY